MSQADLMTVWILRVDGRAEEHRIGRLIGLPWIKRMIDARTLDFVRLRDTDPRGDLMAVDDEGIARDRPVNPAATALYHAACKPGTTHQIRGDVAIARDQDFA